MRNLSFSFVTALVLSASAACSPPVSTDAGADASPSDVVPADSASPVDSASPSDSAIVDGAVELCSTALSSRSDGCAAANVGLSAEICRCGSKYYWDGAACAATAACRCTSNCERLFDTQAQCETAYSACRGDSGARD
jgi:hypothetical protein